MTTFDKREEGFEKKYALDEEQKFKAEARRNRLLGMWVAEKLGLSGDAASDYQCLRTILRSQPLRSAHQRAHHHALKTRRQIFDRL